ncbi:fluoride efflux transporter CrcB [Paenibacillus sp. GCM10028914]|uniref:fluoride efflux transporter CrcB n=1 Tax=Paenibacillus sp. GCM10028914 TaxID=3273416 RepID=UPI00361FDA81
MIVWIGIGGIVGAVSRYGIGIWVGKRVGSSFPWATLLVNLVGSLLLGILVGTAERMPEMVYGLLGTGFCGAFTTFSTFGYEAITLAVNKHYVQALIYVITSVLLGLAGASIGIMLTI